jgi:ABC-2 type transport system ATP-binding protein
VTGDAAIKTTQLTRRFDRLVAVDRLDLTVRDEVFGLLGPNGAGKTTTIKMLITILPPTSGQAEVAGYDVVRHAGAVRRTIGYVPQLLSADGALTGRENLELSAGLYHLPRAERASRIGEALRFMEIDEVADRLVRTYSGGMIRRLELAQAMLHGPSVLFLDEPTVGLDPTGRDAVWARIRELRDRDGTTILLTTHHMDEADALCDRVAVMHHGVVAAIGTPAELKAEVGPGATLNDVFRKATGAAIDAGGTYRDVARTRRTARRLG